MKPKLCGVLLPTHMDFQSFPKLVVTPPDVCESDWEKKDILLDVVGSGNDKAILERLRVIQNV